MISFLFFLIYKIKTREGLIFEVNDINSNLQTISMPLLSADNFVETKNFQTGSNRITLEKDSIVCGYVEITNQYTVQVYLEAIRIASFKGSYGSFFYTIKKGQTITFDCSQGSSYMTVVHIYEM